MNSSIVSIGLSNPGEPIPQAEISRFMQLAHQLDAQERRKLDFLYRKSGIDSRHSVLEDFQTEEVSDFTFFPKNKELHPFPGTAARMQVFEEKGPELAEQAVRSALQQAEVEANSLTHLILISCTGMVAPGLELDLMRRLDIPSSVERYCIHFMGCYAAFTGIKLADKILHAEVGSGSNNVIFRPFGLEHLPHADHILGRISPVSTGV
jgi:predicted naringenin-chalcone synthase